MGARTTPPAGPIPSSKFGPKLVLGSAAVIALIAAFEGGLDKFGGSRVYADKLAGGLPTVCSGLTRYVTDTPIVVGDYWPADKCKAETRTAIVKVQRELERCFTVLPPQSVFDAATSHAWNNGVPLTCASGAMRAWRVGDWRLGCKRIAFNDSGRRAWAYVKTGKVVNGRPEYVFVQGLANRRDREYAHCMGDVRP